MRKRNKPICPELDALLAKDAQCNLGVQSRRERASTAFAARSVAARAQSAVPYRLGAPALGGPSLGERFRLPGGFARSSSERRGLRRHMATRSHTRQRAPIRNEGVGGFESLLRHQLAS